jgi:endonuclease G
VNVINYGMRFLAAFKLIPFLLITAVAWSMPLPETPAPGPLELPALLPGQILIDHGAFYLVYDEETEQAVWVAYELSWEDINGTAERRDNFREDPLISSGSAELDDYRGSGYDRGHLVPAADMKLDQASMDTSFYLSNISPQLPGFNRDIWRDIEAWTRENVSPEYPLYVVTGPLFLEKIAEPIGGNGVDIPSHFFKALLRIRDPDDIQGIAVLIPHDDELENFTPFLASIDFLEEISGLDVFPGLPDRVEERAEAGFEFTDWGLPPP